MDRLLYRVHEAADMLGISRAKAYELVTTARLPSVMIDGSRRIPAEELRAYVDRIKAESGLATVA